MAKQKNDEVRGDKETLTVARSTTNKILEPVRKVCRAIINR